MKFNALFPLCVSLSLVACGPNQSVEEKKGEPPLIVAAETGDLARIEALLAKQSDVDTRDSCRWTPLMKAALNGHTSAVQRLLESGAQPNLGDKGGYTALMLAASNNHADIVELLLRHGADIDPVESTEGFSALIWSAKLGHPEVIKILLQHGADPTLRDHKGMTALDWAKQNNHQAAARLLSDDRP